MNGAINGKASWKGCAAVSLSLVLSFGEARRSEAQAPPSHRAALLEALSAVERGVGEARAEARLRFLDARTRLDLEPVAEDADLLPRFEALLGSTDTGDVELGIRLVGAIGDRHTLPALWTVASEQARDSRLRMQALDTIASRFHDPKVIPALRESIAHEDSSTVAINSLGHFAADPTVAAYLRGLLRDPKHVTAASGVLRQHGISFDPKEAAVPQLTYSRWSEGISIDSPQDWPIEDRPGYSQVFRNRLLDAYYGYQVIRLDHSATARRVRDKIAQKEGLRNELSPDRAAPAKEAWARTGATDMAAGRYLIRKDGRELVRRTVVLTTAGRAIIVSGESARQSAGEFESVFDRMWPTIRIGTPDPDAAESLQKAVSKGPRGAP